MTPDTAWKYVKQVIYGKTKYGGNKESFPICSQKCIENIFYKKLQFCNKLSVNQFLTALKISARCHSIRTFKYIFSSTSLVSTMIMEIFQTDPYQVVWCGNIHDVGFLEWSKGDERVFATHLIRFKSHVPPKDTATPRGVRKGGWGKEAARPSPSPPKHRRGAGARVARCMADRPPHPLRCTQARRLQVASNQHWARISRRSGHCD